jgi:Group II intron, maturase-specific domain
LLNPQVNCSREVLERYTGFDFLGCNVRRYPCGKLLIKPSKTAVTRIKRRLAEEMRSLRGAAPGVIIGRLNPIITGWAAYYRGVVSTQTFHTLDHYLWRLTYRWALRRHGPRTTMERERTFSPVRRGWQGCVARGLAYVLVRMQPAC